MLDLVESKSHPVHMEKCKRTREKRKKKKERRKRTKGSYGMEPPVEERHSNTEREVRKLGLVGTRGESFQRRQMTHRDRARASVVVDKNTPGKKVSLGDTQERSQTSPKAILL